MIIINLTGGLGNQMFQYAFGRYLSIKNKAELKYHFTNALFNTQRNFGLNIFKIKASEANDSDLKKMGIIKNSYLNRVFYLLDERLGIQLNKHIFSQKFPYKYDKNLKNTGDSSYVQGYFSDPKYFFDIEDILERDFTLRNKLDNHNMQIIRQMHDVNSVSVHVRRADYVTNKANKYLYTDLSFYKKAIQTIKDKIKKPVFYIFSDDIAWCKQKFSYLDMVYFINHNVGNNSYKDMVLMSNCKHNIIANSSFSWWASRLNKNINKIIISPK